MMKLHQLAQEILYLSLTDQYSGVFTKYYKSLLKDKFPVVSHVHHLTCKLDATFLTVYTKIYELKTGLNSTELRTNIIRRIYLKLF